MKDGSLDKLAQNRDIITLSLLITVMLNPDYFFIFCFENTVGRDQRQKPPYQVPHCFHPGWKYMLLNNWNTTVLQHNNLGGA